jgi:hypothetical protein
MKQANERITLSRVKGGLGSRPYDPNTLSKSLLVSPSQTRTLDLFDYAYLDSYQPSSTLPREFEVYRGAAGVTYREAACGKWWTTSWAVSKEYANGRAVQAGGRPFVVCASARRVGSKVVVRSDRWYAVDTWPF